MVAVICSLDNSRQHMPQASS